ncbi:TetR/AcrR family transcriptional regulator [Leucobacter sp. CSA1]|uniref:TetR/AcrR family transcriptional regulator n=1 Tax=Leucobacter chromiisoli TaxID=2796471 RepID=A0A934UUE1_9MICO|nr:TetR/AcrR family transcriptional regulator [Leucobacter chromiisoli]MBK0417842.1 TetR/AcrR family transcriptional regulator [Leucobacter chromiisoli]
MTDARVVRTRAALDRAIAELASEASVSEITVSQLTETAGINRATFYKHFTSPAEALEALLAQELDPVRERLQGYATPGSDPRAVFQSTMTEVLDHIERFRDIYETAFASPHDSTAGHVLAAHFAESARAFLGEPEGGGPLDPTIDRDVVASFIASGLVGAIGVWLRREDCSREMLREAMLAVLPGFWFPGR